MYVLLWLVMIIYHRKEEFFMPTSDRLFERLKGKKIAFVGTGVSHNDLIMMFLAHGMDVTVCDRKFREQLGSLAEGFAEAGAKLSLGNSYLDDAAKCDVVFRTPGMYFNNSDLTEMRRKGVVVTSEMEVFFDLCPCKIYGITGTDGKTTTTTIISEMLAHSGKTVHKGGNIGRALLPIIDEIKPEDAAVVELSSFQLISMRKSPDFAAITNVYPDHLNVHSGMEEYIDAKKNLIAHQNAFSRTVLNMDNEITNGLSDCVRGDLYKFSTKSVPERGAYFDGEWLCFTDGKTTEKIVRKDDIKIPGMHNVENYLTAIAMLHGEVAKEDMEYVAKNFGGVEHRIELVRELDGVKYYNDSIATSPISVIAGLKAFNRRIIVIAGGYDKKLDYGMLSEPINTYVKTLVLLGETADKIEAAVRAYDGYSEENCRIIRVSSMEEAVEAARDAAVSGDIVTLSPASASFDLYRNFEERGHHYKKLVNALSERNN